MKLSNLERAEIAIDERMGADLRAQILLDDQLEEWAQGYAATLCRTAFVRGLVFAYYAGPSAVEDWFASLGFAIGRRDD